VVVTGDVLLHPPLVEQARLDGVATGRDLDFAPMLAGLGPYVRPADLAMCHLETPLAPPDGPFEGYPEFSVPPQVLDGLVTTGFDACSTASNHTLDQGAAGLARTLNDLDAAALSHDGSYRTAEDAQTPTVATTPNGRVGVISATYGLNTGEPDEPWMVTPLEPAAIVAKAERAKAAGADVVIVALHAGAEYQTEPNSDQIDAATALLASPAIDLVYGHHAHVVQPLQRINGKWAIFGLGNMIAAQETPIDQTHEGLLVRVTFSQDDAGNWTTSDVAWVPSLQRAASPFTWCALGTGQVCTSPDADQTALARTTEAVNLLGAAADGAHPLVGG
jgi:poly-gamma-glutamate synthesis protein (capsule biosynthesis protein)